jgi:hypothetical protein
MFPKTSLRILKPAGCKGGVTKVELQVNGEIVAYTEKHEVEREITHNKTHFNDPTGSPSTIHPLSEVGVTARTQLKMVSNLRNDSHNRQPRDPNTTIGCPNHHPLYTCYYLAHKATRPIGIRSQSKPQPYEHRTTSQITQGEEIPRKEMAGCRTRSHTSHNDTASTHPAGGPSTTLSKLCSKNDNRSVILSPPVMTYYQADDHPNTTRTVIEPALGIGRPQLRCKDHRKSFITHQRATTMTIRSPHSSIDTTTS